MLVSVISMELALCRVRSLRELTRVDGNVCARDGVALQVEVVVDLRELAVAAGQLRGLAVVDLGGGILKIAQVVRLVLGWGDVGISQGLNEYVSKVTFIHSFLLSDTNDIPGTCPDS